MLGCRDRYDGQRDDLGGVNDGGLLIFRVRVVSLRRLLSIRLVGMRRRGIVAGNVGRVILDGSIRTGRREVAGLLAAVFIRGPSRLSSVVRRVYIRRNGVIWGLGTRNSDGDIGVGNSASGRAVLHRCCEALRILLGSWHNCGWLFVRCGKSCRHRRITS